MHEGNRDIISRSNVQSDVVVVNQCNHDSIEEFDFVNASGRKCHVKYINTTTRGLSKSRNIALSNAWGDICQICDDDELLPNNVEDSILEVYNAKQDAGLIAFSLIREDSSKTYPPNETNLGFRQLLKTSSHQITFDRKQILEKGIKFDEKMGSGTGNGGGEEVRFMLDCRKKGLKLMYSPVSIATVKPSKSQWFKGYDSNFFENQGWTDRRLLGNMLGFVYAIYWPIFRRSVYIKDGISMCEAIFYSIKGFFSKR